MCSAVHPSTMIERWSGSPFAALDGGPWTITSRADEVVARALRDLKGDYGISGTVAPVIARPYHGGQTTHIMRATTVADNVGARWHGAHDGQAHPDLAVWVIGEVNT